MDDFLITATFGWETKMNKKGSYKINNKQDLESFVTCNWNLVNQYLNGKQKNIPVPIYSSVDIRESKTKIAPIDHNFYPAGFNNVCKKDLEKSVPFFANVIKKISPKARTIGIIPEFHTKNLFYIDHLALLTKTINQAGFEVYVLGFDDYLFKDNSKSLQLQSYSKYHVKILKTVLSDGNFKIVSLPKTKIDLILLNNDQSRPLSLDWNQLKVPVVPSYNVGWYRRQKVNHFKYYQKMANEFCRYFSINPDLIQAKFTAINDIDFSSKKGIDKVGEEVDALLKSLGPNNHVFVKAGQGTYGMGISVCRSGEDVLRMNRKIRNKMDIGKNRIKFTSVLIQEGIETILKYDDMPAEIAIYLVDGISIGGFMRTNTEKGTQSNLNSRGMVFKKFCISEIRENQDHQAKEAIYSVIARLSTLASGFEIAEGGLSAKE